MNSLHRAILAGRPAEVIYLLERKNFDPNTRDENLRTPLITCSLAANEDVAIMCAAVLLNNGAKISLSNKQGKNALCWACLKSKVKLVKMFLEDYPNQFQFDLRKKDRDGNTALHLAARAGNPEIVGLLLKAYADNDLGAEVSERNFRGEAPLHLAAKQGNSGAILALLPVSSDALFSRRGAVDFRSAPRWASAAVKVSKSAGDSGVKHNRPFSVHHFSGNDNPYTLTARNRRPKTVTAISSNLPRFPCTRYTSSVHTKSKPDWKVTNVPSRTNISLSEVFQISGIQLPASSAYRRPAKAPPLPTPPSVGEDRKNSRLQSTSNKLPGKNRRGSTLASRSRSSSRRGSEADLAEKQQSKCKAVPTVVIDEAEGGKSNVAARNGSGSGRQSAPAGKEDSTLEKFAKRSSSFNHSMSNIPESPVQGGTFLTPFDGPGMNFEFPSRALSLLSLSSDLPGLLTHCPALDRSVTDPVMTLDGNQATQIRRTKSEPTLNTLDQIIEPLVSGKNTGSRLEHKRSRGTTHRRRGPAKPRVVDKDKVGSAVMNGKRHSKPTPIKLEVPNHAVLHAHRGQGELPFPSAPTSPAPPSRAGRRFFQSGREAEITVQRRRTELERRIRSVQSDIDKLEKRRKGRKYKTLIPDWVTVDGNTKLEELVTTVLNDQSSLRARNVAARKQNNSQEVSSKETGVTLNNVREPRRFTSASTSSVLDNDSLQERYNSCASSLDLEADMHNAGRPQKLTGIPYSTDGKSPRLLRNNLHCSRTTLNLPQPAQAPVCKQSRSIFPHHPENHHRPKQQLTKHHLSNNYRERGLQSRSVTMRSQGSGIRYKPIKPGPSLNSQWCDG